jgi:predicted permease
VQSAAYASSVPFASGYTAARVHAEGKVLPPGQMAPQAVYNDVTSDYFKTMRIPLLRGRAFTDADREDTPKVAIVNEFMAQRFWPKQNPLGKRFALKSSTSWIQVVGVAQNAKYLNPAPGFRPYVYLAMVQGYDAKRTLQIRTSVPPESNAQDILMQIQALAPDLPVSMLTMDQQLQGINGFYIFHVSVALSLGIGFLGLFLAIIGVYGVVSFVTSKRSHEVGVRMALGAQQTTILKLLIMQGVSPVGIGVAAGIVVSLFLARGITRFLPYVSWADPLTFGSAFVVVMGSALLAFYVPARKATRTDPVSTLRHE